MFTSLTIAGRGTDPTRGGRLFADGAHRHRRRRANRAFDLGGCGWSRPEDTPAHDAKPIKELDLTLAYDMSRVGVDMAFRLWLRLSKFFVEASALSERIIAAVRNQRTEHKAPPAHRKGA
jgi:hypothetical protein